MDIKEAEIEECLNYLDLYNKNYPSKLRNSTLILSNEILNTKKIQSKYIDTLALLFDIILIPHLSGEMLCEMLEDDKVELYMNNKIIQCVDTENMRWLDKSLHYDIYLDENYSPRPVSLPLKKHPLDEYGYIIIQVMENLPEAYRFINRHRLPARFGNVYRAFHAVIRNEIIGDAIGCNILYDTKLFDYSMLKYGNNINVLDLFLKWMETPPFELKEFNAQDILEYRDKYGTFQSFLERIKYNIIEGIDISDCYKEFSNELNKRISKALKMKGRTDNRSIYIAGLVSSVGSLIGGVKGAMTSGIGAALCGQIAQHYLNRSEPEIKFILDHKK